MAKSARKTAGRGAKKSARKKKVIAKAKKSSKAKTPARKVKKVVAKNAAAKTTLKKESGAKKTNTRGTLPGKKADGKGMENLKPQLQLHVFPALTQRPIAHKPAKSSVSDDKTRYRDEELKEFETLIKDKLEKSREEIRILKETLNRSNDARTDSTSGGNTKVLEDGAETAEKENLSQLAARQLKYITNLENALVRIKNRTYGICTVTGKLIPKERLIAVPHTTQSIEAKMMQHD